MGKIVNLYSFEIKPALIDESDNFWTMLAVNKVLTPARLEWLRDWEYIDNALDVVQFIFS